MSIRPTATKPRRLTARQRRFVEEYLQDANAVQAAIRAGYRATTARRAGRLLAHPAVQAELSHRQAARAEQQGISAQWVLARLAAEAEADLADLYAGDGTIRPVGEWPLIWRQGLVAGVETTRRGTGEAAATVEKIRLCDRIRRLDMIGKHTGVQAFREQADRSDDATLKSRIEEARARVLGQKGVASGEAVVGENNATG